MIVIQIAGHIGRDPESRFTSSGQKVTSFSVATNTKKGGQELTTWYKITLWGERFDKMLPYMKKGSAVMVTGTLQPPEIYTKQDGTQGVSLEVTGEMVSFSPFGRGGQEGDSGSHQQKQQNRATPSAAPAGDANEDPFAFSGSNQGGNFSASEDDDLPF